MQARQVVVPLTLGDLRAETETNLVHMGDLFHLGNVYRYQDGLGPLNLQAWIQREDVKDYIQFLEDLGIEAIKRKRGKNGGTWAHLNVAIDAAMALSPSFKHDVIQTFVNDRVLGARSDGGDMFKDLNAALKAQAEAVLGKPAHKGHYITLAMAIKDRILEDGKSWDTARAGQHHARYQIEDRLATMLKAGVVKDWDHLKELAKTV